jgi:uncharacterized membrane protein
MSAPTKKSRVPGIIGLVVTATGLSHYVKPDLYQAATVSAFPRDTRKHIYINGTIETAIGLGLLSSKTRKAALAGTAAYGLYLGANALRNR